MKAERIVRAGMKELAWDEGELEQRSKGDLEKVRLGATKPHLGQFKVDCATFKNGEAQVIHLICSRRRKPKRCKN